MTVLFRILRSQKGIGIVEGLAASVIVVIAALGMGVGFQQMGKTRTKIKAVSYAMSLESALQSKLQDKNTYSAIAAQLAGGDVSTLDSLSFSLSVPIENTTKTPTITVGQDVYFDKDANLCTGCSSGSDWLFRLRVEAQKKVGPAFPVYALAYRVDFNSEIAPLGTIGSLSASGFAVTDYKWPVPPESYINSTLVPCDPTNKEVFVTGMNKDTGQAYCMRLLDTVSCAANEVVDGWRIVGGNLQVHCKSLKTSLPPVAPYVVQSFNPAAGDTSISGTSVVITDSPWPLQTASGFAAPYMGRSVAGTICPPNYNFVGTCTTTGINSWPGYIDVGCPAGQTGGPVWSPVPPTAVGALTNTSSGAGVNCDLANPVQPTGSGYDAGWDANIRVTGSCVLNIPVTLPL